MNKERILIAAVFHVTAPLKEHKKLKLFIHDGKQTSRSCISFYAWIHLSKHWQICDQGKSTRWKYILFTVFVVNQQIIYTRKTPLAVCRWTSTSLIIFCQDKRKLRALDSPSPLQSILSTTPESTWYHPQRVYGRNGVRSRDYPNFSDG